MSIPSNSVIREYLLERYPQMFSIAKNKLAEIKEFDPSTSKTQNSIIESFISDAKQEHDYLQWGSNYIKGVTLLTCHFMSESQSKSVNSGLVVREKTGSESETEYMRPSLNNFGKYSTTKYGRAWEALRDSFYNGPLLV